MKLEWGEIFTADLPEDDLPRRRKPQVQCLCGRFAKWAGDRHYYNGWFNCYEYYVNCSRCGEVTIKCT